MKDLNTLRTEIEACIEREIEAQRSVLALIEVQERALQTGGPDEIASATAAIEAELRAGAVRGGDRMRILAGLGGHWHVAPSSLTLSSIAERLGAACGRLPELRVELRTTMAEVVRRCRRMGALARANGKIVNEAIERVFGDASDERVSGGGKLVNTEA